MREQSYSGRIHREIGEIRRLIHREIIEIREELSLNCVLSDRLVAL
jgi:hypothetical protein